MSKRSIQVWVVMERGWEYETPIKAYKDKKLAERKAAERSAEVKKGGAPVGFTGHYVARIPLIMFEGKEQ